MSKIQWTGRTLNAFVGCRRVSEGCRGCYAERFVHRGMAPQHRGLTVSSKHGPRWNGKVNYVPARFDEMLRATKPDLWFINSLSDLFFEPVPFETIGALLGMMAVAHDRRGHVAQILTKRPERARRFFDWLGAQWPDPRRTFEACMSMVRYTVNSKTWDRATREVLDVREPYPYWLGVSVEDQATAEDRIPHLLHTPAAVRWISYEPALGPVDFRAYLGPGMCSGPCEGHPPERPQDHGRHPAPGLDWIVIGGESGPGARPFDIEWARTTIAQGREAGVPVFVKQLGADPRVDISERSTGEPWVVADRKGGEPSEWPEDLRVREMPA